MKKLHNSQIISELVLNKLLGAIVLLMCNFIANSCRILGICKDLQSCKLYQLQVCQGLSECTGQTLRALWVATALNHMHSLMMGLLVMSVTESLRIKPREKTKSDSGYRSLPY